MRNYLHSIIRKYVEYGFNISEYFDRAGYRVTIFANDNYYQGYYLEVAIPYISVYGRDEEDIKTRLLEAVKELTFNTQMSEIINE